MQNKVVVRYLDGRILKGFTTNFMPNKDTFHLTPSDEKLGVQAQTVNIKDCKAVFFVKDFTGKSDYQDKKEFPARATAGGRKIKVVFKDQEILIGTTQGYQPGRPGFFLFPADPESNIDRCYVVAASTLAVAFI